MCRWSDGTICCDNCDEHLKDLCEPLWTFGPLWTYMAHFGECWTFWDHFGLLKLAFCKFLPLGISAGQFQVVFSKSKSSGMSKCLFQCAPSQHVTYTYL